MDNTYYLDLVVLLKTLANISAMLIAELPDGVPGYNAICRGYIRVHNNVIIMSIIMSDGKVIAEGLRALHLLENNKKWHVSFSTDLLDNTQQQKLLPPPRPNMVTPQLSTREDQRYFSTPVQQSPTTDPLTNQSSSQIDIHYPRTTGPLSLQNFSSTSGPPYSSPSRQSEMPRTTTHSFIQNSKIFQQSATLTSEVMERYNMKERLILRTIYAKVNGQRRVDQLKEELRLPVATVERALTELERLGVID